MQPVSPRIVELLNEALTLELTVTNAYFLHARMLDAQGLPLLGKVFYDLSIGEMRDADELIQRILFFDAHPNLQRLGPVAIGADRRGDAAARARGREQGRGAVQRGRRTSAATLGDHGTASIFDEMVRDEEGHADWFEAQLAAIEVVGESAYLARQIDPGAAPA